MLPLYNTVTGITPGRQYCCHCVTLEDNGTTNITVSDQNLLACDNYRRQYTGSGITLRDSTATGIRLEDSTATGIILEDSTLPTVDNVASVIPIEDSTTPNSINLENYALIY